jgi:hypothetical protein
VDNSRRMTVRARCRQALGELDIAIQPAHQLSVADIRDRVQRWRGRPLHLMPVVTGPGWPSGMWLDTEQADLVLFDAATSALHMVNIIAHEIGHIVLGHAGAMVHPATPSRFRWLGTGSPTAAVMLRTGFLDHDEHEAEVFATMMCARIGDHRIPATMPALRDSEDLVGRLLVALADPLEGR